MPKIDGRRSGFGRYRTAWPAAVLAILVLLSLSGTVGRVDALCAQIHWGDCIYTWGYTDPNNLGWLVPANTTVIVPLQTNVTSTGWMEAELTLFPYQVQPLTSAHMGLYVNGELIASSSYSNMSESDIGGYGGSCSPSCGTEMLGMISPGLAIFSDWTWQLSLYHSISWPLSIPSGSTVSLAFESSKPVWISIDNKSSGLTYEVAHSSFASLPTASPQSLPTAPYTVAAWVYSPNPSAPSGIISRSGPSLESVVGWFVVLAIVSVAVVCVGLVVLRASRRSKRPDSQGSDLPAGEPQQPEPTS